MDASLHDTICAISSPIGEGGIAIIRMSGPDAHTILASIFRARNGTTSLVSRHLYLGFVFDNETGMDVDEVFAVSMEQPHTYTCEQMAEIYSHAGVAVQKQILALMMKNGARIAEPGEFTRKAYLNGRIDLTQAESVLDIIKSESDKELQYALMNAKGMLSEKINGIKEEITALLAEVEARIDFPEEELEITEEGWLSRLTGVGSALSSLIASYEEGRAVRSGLDVLIVGRPNVGKSSLLNALLMKDRAIVTPIPGTTRDLVEDTLHVRGIKFNVTDTAGLGQPRDEVEKEGIDRVMKRIPEVDIILWVLDGSEAYTTEDEDVYKTIKEKTTIVALNKSDLPAVLNTQAILPKGLSWLDVSALTGSGLDSLRESLYNCFLHMGHKGSGLLVTNVRHRDILAKAQEALQRAFNCCNNREPFEFLAFELRDALTRLGEITGETCSDEILHDIFSRFCVGK